MPNILKDEHRSSKKLWRLESNLRAEFYYIREGLSLLFLLLLLLQKLVRTVHFEDDSNHLLCSVWCVFLRRNF